MFSEESKEVSFLRRFSWVVVTGGSSGIGAEFLRAIDSLAPGAFVCNLSRTRPEAFTDCERRRHFTCDLERIEELQAVAAELLAMMLGRGCSGPVLLVNNSGFGAYGEFPDPNPGHNASMVDLNCRAPVLLTGLLWPEILRRGGQIVNVASLAAYQPTPFLATYAASKAFLLHWSLALDCEGRRHGVRSLAVCPGPTATNFFRRAGFGEAPVPGYGLTPEQVVRESISAMAKGRAQVVNGFPNKLLAFFSQRMPKAFAASMGWRLMARLRLKPLREAKRRADAK